MASEKPPTKMHFDADALSPPRFAPSPGLFPFLSQAYRKPLTEGGSTASSDSFSHIADSVAPSDTEVVSSVHSSPRAESPQLSYETDSEPPGDVEEPFTDQDISELNDDPARNLPPQTQNDSPYCALKHLYGVGSHASVPNLTNPVADRQVV
ncbi:hypothetical protein FRC09_006572 [Ceratobasidium sp. 395]|nr:hypothetical protein FRC09_006572 [Ceratobasidium sp. 395]